MNCQKGSDGEYYLIGFDGRGFRSAPFVTKERFDQVVAERDAARSFLAQNATPRKERDQAIVERDDAIARAKSAEFALVAAKSVNTRQAEEIKELRDKLDAIQAILTPKPATSCTTADLLKPVDTLTMPRLMCFWQGSCEAGH